jgi:protein-disulfide isomerase
MDRTRWIIFALICIAALSWLVFTSRSTSTNVSNVDAFTIQRGDGETIADHVYGNPNAKVVLFEYGDFQCPACASAYPIVKAVKEKYKDDLAFVFRNLPLTTIHPNAIAAASAAEAAGKQDKFWEMHDLLYENQNAWKDASAESRTDVFVSYGDKLGLKVDQLRQDMQDKSVSDKISQDRAFAKKVGADSTPTFFLGNQELTTDDWNQEGALDAKVRAALEAAGVDVSGTEPAKTNE